MARGGIKWTTPGPIEYITLNGDNTLSPDGAVVAFTDTADIVGILTIYDKITQNEYW